MFRNLFIYLFVPAFDTRQTKVALGIITLIGTILRLYIINDPIGYDEAYTFINFSSKSFKFILADYHAPNNHILNSLLIGIAYRIFGNHIWIVRLPAFLAGVIGIPAAYIAARRLFSAQQSLSASAVLALAPNIIAASTNGRGYSLVILFSLLLMNFAGILVKQPRRPALFAYAVTGALGFYSIPIFLYPMAGISLWVVITYLTNNDSRETKWDNLRNFLLSCAVSGVLMLTLYSPVIFFGTGFNSIVANDIVRSTGWIEFGDNLLTRSSLTWQSWMQPLTSVFQYIILAGFLISIFLFRKISDQKLPMQVFIFLGAGIMLVLQRVVPLPRIWSYLEMFYLLFSAAGLVGVGHLISKNRKSQTALSGLVLLFVLVVFANITLRTQTRQARLDRTIAPEFFAAEFLAENLTEADTVIAVAPADIQTAYYLKIRGVPYDVFYQRDHPVQIQNAMVLVRTRGEYNLNTLEKVLDFYELTSKLNVASGQQVFEYGPLFIVSIPVK